MGTKSGTIRKIYIDGIDRTTVFTNQSTLNNTGLLNIGQWGGGNFFPGSLDEVAVYNYAMPRSKVSAHYVASGRSLPSEDEYKLEVMDDNPVLYLRLGEGG